MKFVKIDKIDGGYFLDPRAYIKELKTVAPHLPPGARTFAEDPEHYDLSALRCIKDLRLFSMEILDGNGALSLQISFSPNKFTHDSGLVIRYAGMVNLSIEASQEDLLGEVWPETRRLGDVQLDEILPQGAGCLHEIGFTGGTIRVVSADLVAEWR
ncbi:hypothetical protein [Kribbella endophytica]